jgi:DNA-binding response OmpR family regulator/EAL domain-containing protein (putative c-di-GMP-specific phosphodiesterase class I)
MPDTFAKEFQLLRSKYIANLTERASQISELWSMLRYLKWSDQGLRALQHLAHQLAGSGDTFGFPAISHAARQLESYLTEHQNPAQLIGGMERKVIDEHIAALTNLLRTAADPSQQVPVQQSAEPVKQGHNKKIFIVDDDTALSALLAVYLRSAGFEVTTFESPASCMQQLEQELPDAVLMDLLFPTEGRFASPMPGITALQDIHQRVGEGIPVILISSRSDLNARLQALRAGGAGYLTKPLDFPVLVKTLLATIEQHEPVHRVMIVDDDQAVAEFHAGILRNQGMEVMCVNQAMQTFQRAAQFKPALMILDMHMPDINGVELATLLRQEPLFTLLPIIFLTADHSEKVHERIQALGVNGLLTKPVEPAMLVQECQTALHNTQLLKSRIEHVIRKRDNHQVTRHFLFAAIENELQRAQTSTQSAAVYYISVDQLEKLDKTYGYSGMAELHDAFCERLANVIGSQEQWAAIANLTACVLVSARTTEHHQQRARHIIQRLTAEPYTVQGEDRELHICIGVAYLNSKNLNVNDVIFQAEKAHESAQQSGDEGVASHLAALADNTEQPATGTSAISEPMIDITDTLPLDKLALSYQPVVNLENNDINHYDVLVRWRREDGELISAANFLHRIENPKLLVELDRWILQSAVNAMMADSSTRESATLFLHLSAHTLQQKLFFSFATNLMRNTRLRGNRRIVFILEESWVIAEASAARTLVKALQDAQCGVCLSRAGESPEALHLLDDLVFDYIRLSTGLTGELAKHEERIAQLVAAARTQESRVIATHVEDARHLAALWQLGVTLFQGFFIQPPGNVFHKKNDLAYNKAHEI